MTNPSSSRTSTAIGACSLLFWGTSIPFARKCSEDLGPFTTASVILLIGSMLGASLFGALGHFSLRRSAFLRDSAFWWRSVMFAAYTSLLYLALGLVDREQVPTVTFLNYLWPTVTVVSALIIFRQRVRLVGFAIGSVLVLAGIAVELLGVRALDLLERQNTSHDLIAYLAAFAAAGIWGLYSALSRKWGMRTGGVAAIPFVFLFAGTVALPGRWLFQESSRISADTWPALIFLCVAPLLGHLCWDVGMRKGNIVLLSLLADTLPWISLTFAQLYLSVPIGPETWWAAVLIVAGAVVSRFSVR